MRRHSIKFLWTCTACPGKLFAQIPAPVGTQPQSTPAPPRPRPNRSFPAPNMINGQPIESRPPEKSDDKPAFPGQTRAPFQASAPFNVTILTDKLKSPRSLEFLPDGKFLVAEKPGTMRILDANGALSAPLTGVPTVSVISQAGLLDVALDPCFASNKRIFFTYSEPVGDENSNIVVARARLDEAAGALEAVKVIFRANSDLPKTRAANEGGRIAIGRDGNLFCDDWRPLPIPALGHGAKA